jgi:uncharacterized protein (TIGR00369 family)
MPDKIKSADDMQDFFDRSQFNQWTGLTVESVDSGRAVLKIIDEEKLHNPGGNLHGGILAALVDLAAGAALMCAHVDTDECTLVTTDMNVRYLRPGTGTVYAIGEVERVGSSLGITTVDIESVAPDGERKKVAMGSVSYRLIQ